MLHVIRIGEKMIKTALIAFGVCIVGSVCLRASEKSFVFPGPLGLPAEIYGKRQSSYPYISGDTFRAIADFVIDEKKIPFYPSKVKEGDVIFLKVDCIEFFFTTVHQHIPCRYILITHNGDRSAPGSYARFLDDQKLIAWFGHNCDIKYHPKFFPLPIGVADSCWPHGNTGVIEQVRSKPPVVRPHLLYVNIANSHPERVVAARAFAGKSFCTNPGRKPFLDYLGDLSRSKFALSPRGNGLDCHRTWEALLLGAIPVMKHSTLDPLYDGLPVVLVDSWEEVSEAYLNDTWKEMQQQVFTMERAMAPYWIERIERLKREVKGQCS